MYLKKRKMLVSHHNHIDYEVEDTVIGHYICSKEKVLRGMCTSNQQTVMGAFGNSKGVFINLWAQWCTKSMVWEWIWSELLKLGAKLTFIHVDDFIYAACGRSNRWGDSKVQDKCSIIWDGLFVGFWMCCRQGNAYLSIRQHIFKAWSPLVSQPKDCDARTMFRLQKKRHSFVHWHWVGSCCGLRLRLPECAYYSCVISNYGK